MNIAVKYTLDEGKTYHLGYMIQVDAYGVTVYSAVNGTVHYLDRAQVVVINE